MQQKPDRQREHQANERTFLAWLRTAIAFIGFGLAIARFGLFLRELQASVTGQNVISPSVANSPGLGVALVMLGLVLIALATWRYNQVFWQIEQADYRPSRWTIWVTAAMTVLLGLLSLPFVGWRNAPSGKSSPESKLDSSDRVFELFTAGPRRRKIRDHRLLSQRMPQKPDQKVNQKVDRSI